MKILIYGDYYKFKSGYAREIADLIPHFKKAGHEVRQVALGYNGFPRDNDIVVYHTKLPDVKDYYAQEVLHFAIDDFKPDIVLTVQDFFMLPKISFTLAHPSNYKWVHWGTLDSEPLDYYSRESLNWMHYCFFHSHHAAIQCKIINPALMGEVVYPAVNPKVFHKIEDKTALKSQYKLNEFNVLICNARGQQRKNVPVLLDAFKEVLKEVPNTVLIMSSGISNTKTDENRLDGYDLDRFVSELGLTDYVLLPRSMNRGPIDDDTLNVQYNLADINILPSWGEGFGLPFTEAGISEVPSIGFDHSAVHEVVLNKGVLVKADAYAYNLDGSKYFIGLATDLKKAIVDLLKDEKKRAEYGKAAKEFAEKLSPEKVAKQMLDRFEILLKDDAQPASRRKI
jgi:glycosyltransferase involved in cell wall biosynthesis